MKYLLKWPNGPTYEYTLDELKREAAKGKISGECTVRRADEKTWQSAGELLGIGSTSSQCFVVCGDQRQGPYLPEQIRSMWQSGSITADAVITWEGCNAPVPAKTFLSDTQFGFAPTRDDSGLRSDVTWRVGMTIVGGGVGLLVSYLMRPTVFGRGPSFEEWFTEGFNSPFASTIYTCAAIGLLVGFIIGHFIDSNAKAK